MEIPGESPVKPDGRRERKKAATRATISTAALVLFLERGYDAVSVKQIAERADVAVATVFAHFSGKEAVVFDRDDAVIASLIDAVARRSAGVDVLEALQTWFVGNRATEAERNSDPDLVAFRRLVSATPALGLYWENSWRRHEPALAAAIERTTDIESTLARLVSALVIEGYLLAAAGDRSDHTLTLLFHVLRSGAKGLDGAEALARPDASPPGSKRTPADDRRTQGPRVAGRD